MIPTPGLTSITHTRSLKRIHIINTARYPFPIWSCRLWLAIRSSQAVSSCPLRTLTPAVAHLFILLSDSTSTRMDTLPVAGRRPTLIRSIEFENSPPRRDPRLL
jgi:hypothetical protein